jgi:hypothetical protein
MTSEDEIHEEQKQEIRIEKTISERAVSRLENASKSMPPIEIQGEIQEQKEEEPSKKLF